MLIIIGCSSYGLVERIDSDEVAKDVETNYIVFLKLCFLLHSSFTSTALHCLTSFSANCELYRILK